MVSFILEVQNLKKYFPVTAGIFRKVVGVIKAVDNVSFTVKPKETFALVGESGCGKTTLGLTIARLYTPTDGKIFFDGQEVTDIKNEKLNEYRRNVQIVFQDPSSSLNPRRKIKDIIAAPMEVHKIGTKSERMRKVRELLNRVELPEEFMYDYPHSLSGGQKQRVAIARALALNPKLIILDEPTSSLDVSVQGKILSLLSKLQAEYGLTYIFISHDISVVRNISQSIAVMYLGKIVELAETNEIFKNPLHPYTRALFSAVPVVSDEELDLLPKEVKLEGETPSSLNPPKGCVFHPRCYAKREGCEINEPPLIEFRKNHFVKCHLFN